MSSEKEKLEKKKLYFDKGEKEFIEIDIDQNKTYQNIYDENKIKIEEKIKLKKGLSNDSNFDLDMELELGNYYFCLVEPKNKDKQKEMIASTIDLKLNLNETAYKAISNNLGYILCFLQKNKSKMNLRKNARSLFVLEKDIYEDTQDSKLQDNTIKENISEEILFKNTIFLYELKNKNFIKKDIVIDYEKISITKDNKTIYISRIKNLITFIMKQVNSKNMI